MELSLFEVLIGASVLFISLYYYFASNFDHWKKCNVEGPKPTAFFGNYKNVILGKVNEAELLKDFYVQYKDEPLIGVYERSKPKLIVKDLDLIKDVLIKDFNLFADKGFPPNIRNSANLAVLDYERWKPLRSKLSPTFTSGKLKDMFYLMTECADNFQKYVEKVAEKDEPIECRELTAKFTTDSIGVCAFGLDMKALSAEDSEFRNFGRSIFEPSLKNKVKYVLREFLPPIYALIGFLQKSSGNNFFADSIKETIQYRKNNKIRRNDFLDLLMDLLEKSDKSSDFEFTETVLVAQAFVFFLGGFETSSTTMSNALYELALNPDIQDKLRSDIKETLDKNDGKLTYDCIKSMQYLDKVFKETLRKYPLVYNLVRSSRTEYTFSGGKVTIPKNTKIAIPVWSIHRDPDIYPNPEVYDPERFDEENQKMRHPMSWLSFGDGPRNCIGLRFANFQSKIGIATIIAKFRVDVCDKTCKEYRLEPRNPLSIPVGGLHIKMTKI